MDQAWESVQRGRRTARTSFDLGLNSSLRGHGLATGCESLRHERSLATPINPKAELTLLFHCYCFVFSCCSTESPRLLDSVEERSSPYSDALVNSSLLDLTSFVQWNQQTKERRTRMLTFRPSLPFLTSFTQLRLSQHAQTLDRLPVWI